MLFLHETTVDMQTCGLRHGILNLTENLKLITIPWCYLKLIANLTLTYPQTEEKDHPPIEGPRFFIRKMEFFLAKSLIS